MTVERKRGALASNHMIHTNCKDIAFQSIHDRSRPAPATGAPLHKEMGIVAR